MQTKTTDKLEWEVITRLFTTPGSIEHLAAALNFFSALAEWIFAFDTFIFYREKFVVVVGKWRRVL